MNSQLKTTIAPLFFNQNSRANQLRLEKQFKKLATEMEANMAYLQVVKFG